MDDATGRREHAPGAKAPFGSGCERAKPEGLAYLEANASAEAEANASAEAEANASAETKAKASAKATARARKMRGSIHCGGKCAASGRDDDLLFKGIEWNRQR
jgi:membrane protein involved in colicin uptake